MTTNPAEKTKEPTSLESKCLLQNETAWRSLKGGDSEESKKQAESSSEILKERLGRLLLSQNLLVLFGSGASMAIAGPSMQDIWNEAEETEKATFTEVCDAVGHVEIDQDIEKLLSRCQRALEFPNAKSDTIEGFIEKVEAIIRDRCRGIEAWGKAQGNTQSVSEKIQPHTVLLSRFVPRRQDLPRTRVFTTNYDLCIELAAKERRMPILDGFDLINPRTFDGRWFDYDFVRRSAREGAADYLESVFHLYKLHGSVDWHRSKAGIIRDPVTKKPYLIYPRDEKYALSFEQPFLEMMARFQMALRERDTSLLLIGFGFNDYHLTQPIYNALATNPNFKAVVVDRSPEVKLGDGKAWDTLWRLHGTDAPLDFVQMDFKDFPNALPTYSQAREGNAQEKAAQLLKVLSSKA